MEGLSLLKKLLQKGDLCKLDLKDAYFSIALHKISQKYLRFPCWENPYEFLCLRFGLGPAPRIFTKLIKIPIALVRCFNVQLIIYLDNNLTYEKLTRGNHDVEGHIDFSIAESGVCNKLSKLCFESFS